MIVKYSKDGVRIYIVDREIIRHCECFLELLIDLEAQLPTRRFFNALLDDHAVVVLCRMAPFADRENNDVERMKQMLETLAFYAKFEINDQTGLALTQVDMTEAHSSELIRLQVRKKKNQGRIIMREIVY